MKKFECLAVGSVPHKSLDKAMSLVKENFSQIPFWPQMVKIDKNEDMIVQFTQNMPSFFSDGDKIYLETESDEFFGDLETFFEHYGKIVKSGNDKVLENYAVGYSLAFEPFIEIVRETKPAYAKGQITGPFTLSAALTDKAGRCALYDETLREIIVKTLSLKAIWQIKRIKAASPETTPVIFIDEPSVSQLGTSAFLTISAEEVTGMIKEVSDLIQENGALSAIHCCGKFDWALPVNAGVNIINFDAYAQNPAVFHSEIKRFLENGGKIAWGVVPTLDKDALQKADLQQMIRVFENGVKNLTAKGINEKIILDNSLVTPSCGAGGLSEELAQKAMSLTCQLSKALRANSD
ncbi:MAG: hypothetical protein LBK53_06625 [Heliobacteriaceae bacterium]|nr:hypothetical protein [Heliobacteriaceae bacterium]